MEKEYTLSASFDAAPRPGCQDITHNMQDMFSLVTLGRDGIGYTDGLALMDAVLMIKTSNH